MSALVKTSFAPQLYIPGGITDISFYEKAFNAVEMQRWSNDDGSVHVAELSIEGALFHLHEDKPHAGRYNPGALRGITALIGLFTDDVDVVFKKAVEAGGIVVSPPTTYDYRYRQAEIQDPFGHVWLIEKKLETQG